MDQDIVTKTVYHIHITKNIRNCGLTKAFQSTKTKTAFHWAYTEELKLKEARIAQN